MIATTYLKKKKKKKKRVNTMNNFFSVNKQESTTSGLILCSQTRLNAPKSTNWYMQHRQKVAWTLQHKNGDILRLHLHFSFMHCSRRFYPKRLTLHSSYRFFCFFTFLSALAFPGNRTHDLGVASAMLYYLSYRKACRLTTKKWESTTWGIILCSWTSSNAPI